MFPVIFSENNLKMMLLYKCIFHQSSLKILIFATFVVTPSNGSAVKKSYLPGMSTKEKTVAASTNNDTYDSWRPRTVNSSETVHQKTLVQSENQPVGLSPYYGSTNSGLTGYSAPFRKEILLPQANSYNERDNYYYNNNNTSKSYYGYYKYQNDLHMPNQVPQKSKPQTTHSEEYNYHYPIYPVSYSDELQLNEAQPQFLKWRKHQDEEELPEIEDKVFSKTVVATKALKVGKIVFTFCMVLVVLILAGLGKVGVTVSPVVLPFALLPIGVIALLLFIPLFVLFVPLAATGLAGERKKRRRKRNVEQLHTLTHKHIMENLLSTLQAQLPKILDEKLVDLEDNK